MGLGAVVGTAIVAVILVIVVVTIVTSPNLGYLPM